MTDLMMPLGLLAAGETAEVAEIRWPQPFSPRWGWKQHQRGCCSRIESLGLRAGKIVEMLHNPGHGAVLVMVDGSRIALGRGVAMKIMVRRKD